MPYCNTCKQEKDASAFGSRGSRLRKPCKQCSCEYMARYRTSEENQLRAKQYKHIWHASNKERLNKKSKEYAKKHQSRIKEYKKSYNPKRRVDRAHRRKTDLLFKLSERLRGGVVRAFNLVGWGEKGRSRDLLGCDLETAKAHIERQFKPGMTWDNWGEWHVDHRIPLSSAKTPDEMRHLCHYRNLQPLWKLENLTKNSRLLPTQTYLAI